MAVFQIGSIIRTRREEMGLSQEDLADGICAVPTLSRIENNERLPTKNHFEMLMQRLGYNITSLDFFVDKKDFFIHELRFKMQQAYMDKDLAAVNKHIVEYEQLVKEPTRIDEQILLLYKTLISDMEDTDANKLKRFEDALRLTCPKYDRNYFPHVLSYEEIILLNNIAICYYVQGQQDNAISLLFGVKKYYDRCIINSEEALRTKTMILYNLSKVLGLSGRYDECIEICDLGIRVARTTGRCPSLGKTLFNRGWALLQRNCTGDKDAAKVALKQCYYFYEVMESRTEADFVREFYAEWFDKDDLM